MSKVKHLNQNNQGIQDTLEEIIDMNNQSQLEEVFIVYKYVGQPHLVTYGYSDFDKLIGVLSKAKLMLELNDME